MVISDIVSERPLPKELTEDLDSWSQCISGALEMKDYLGRISRAGFEKTEIVSQHEFYAEGVGKDMHRLLSITVRAKKSHA